MTHVNSDSAQPGLPERLPFRMPDFTRLAWVSDRARDLWQPRIQQICEMLSALELETIERGLRRASLRVVAAAKYDEVTEKLRSRQLHIVKLQGIKQSHAYSASLDPCPQGDPDAFWCAVAKEADISYFAAVYGANDNVEIGRLLGYPPCCTEFFQKTWVSASLVDTTWPMAFGSCGKQPVDAHQIVISSTSECGTQLRWLGIRAVFHLPCSFECEPSIQLARQHLGLAQELGFDQEVEWLTQMLEWPVEWSALHGIAEIRTPVVKIVTRTDATASKYLVRYLGNRRSMPSESLSGLVFPFNTQLLPVVTGSHGFSLGLENPIDTPSPHANYEQEKWFCEDNGFRTRYAMDRAHEPILARVKKLLQEQPELQERALVIDFGCGNGVLLKKLMELSITIQTFGMDIDPLKIEHSKLIHQNSPAEFQAANLFSFNHETLSEMPSISILMIGRLLEVEPEVAASFCQLLKRSTYLLVYAYEDYIREAGSLQQMADRMGIELIDQSSDNVSLATIRETADTLTSTTELLT